MGCPSIYWDYVLLPLVNKEADLANSQAEESQVGNPRKKKGKKKWSQRKETRCEVTSHESHGKV